MIKHQEYTTRSEDGKSLFYQTLIPEGDLQGLILLVHGIGEHSSRYLKWMDKFCEKGFACIAIDYRGHGKSEGKRGHINNYECFMKDIDVLFREADKHFPKIKTRFLYGHSMGGGIVSNYALRRKPELTGLIVSSPWLKLSVALPSLRMALGKIMQHIFPAFPQKTGLHLDNLTHNEDVKSEYREDNLIHDSITPGLLFSCIDAGLYAIKNAGKIHCKTLIMHGTSDHITSPAGSKELSEKSDLIELKLWQDAYHELHNEVNRDEIFDFIMSFIGKCMKED